MMKKYGSTRWEIAMGFILLLAVLGAFIQVVVYLTGAG